MVKLWLKAFPKNCEIDSNLMQDIAQKAAPTLKNLTFYRMNLEPQAMQSLIGMLNKLIELNAPI